MDSTCDHYARPLSGVRVLDLTRVLAGPFCTMILADLGADVVKVEHPRKGDDARHFGPFLPSGLSGYFAGVNRGKRSIALDLKDAKDRETFLQLAARADVLVENFRPGTLEGWGLGEERLRAVNSRLIVASASGFGRTGAYGRRPAYDIIVQAMSGLISVTGADARHPVRVGTSISDILAGLFTVIGILAALRARESAGRGAGLDVAMLDCSVAALENAVGRADVTGTAPGPLGTRHPSITPFQAFETGDRPIVVAAGNDGLWRALCVALDLPELAEDPRFLNNAGRTAHQAELERVLQPVFEGRTAAEWLARLDEAGVPCAPIRNVLEVMEDPHLRRRGMFISVGDGRGASLRTPASPLRFDGAPLPLSTRVPELGGDTEAVIGEWLRGVRGETGASAPNPGNDALERESERCGNGRHQR